MQAIETKYLGITDGRGSRIKARCGAGSVTLSYNHGFSNVENHDAAALALVKKLGWDEGLYPGRLIRGAVPSVPGGYVYTFAYDGRESDTVCIPRTVPTVVPVSADGEDYVAKAADHE